MAAKQSRQSDMSHRTKCTVLEGPPPDRTREPGEFRADCRRSRKILDQLRAYRDEVVRERKGGRRG